MTFLGGIVNIFLKKREEKADPVSYEPLKRFVIIRQGCEYCATFSGVVTHFNNLLLQAGAYAKKNFTRIETIDASLYDKYGIVNHPIIERFKKVINDYGYPLLYIDGHLRAGALHKKDNEGWIQGVLENKGEI